MGNLKSPPQKNPWQALRAATQKAAREGDQIAISSELEGFFEFARTHFSKNHRIRTAVGWKKEDNLRNQPRHPSAK